MTSALFTEVVYLRSRRKIGVDDTNNDIFDWVEKEAPAWVETRQGNESTDAKEQSTSNSWVYLPLDVKVEAVSEVRWGGHVWDVDGDPGVQPGGFVVEGYQQIAIKRVAG